MTNNYRQNAGYCDGYYIMSHMAVAGWDTDSGQRIGAAEEIEGNGDSTAPVVSGNPVIGTDGLTVTVNFDETVVTTGYDDGDFDLDCTSGGDDIALNSVSGSGSSRTFTAAKKIYDDDSCTMDFDADVNADDIEDSAGNDLVTFSDIAVTNNSTQTDPATVKGITISQLIR
jgi:hypothetical protein